MSVSRPPKVLWVTPTLGEHFGGPTTTVANGVIAERRHGLDVELVTTGARDRATRDAAPLQRLAANGVKVRIFPRIALSDRGEAWGLSMSLAGWLIRNAKNYDVLHLQYVWCMTSIVGLIAGRLAGVPVVVTPHESLTRFDIEVASRHPVLRLIKRALRPLFINQADRLVLMSDLERRGTQAGRAPVRTIPHAVLEEAATETPAGRAGGGLRIAFLGRNIEKKGIHLILEAIAASPDRDRRLTIAGPPGPDSYRRELDQMISRFGLEEKIRWAGFVEDRAAFLEEADVLAMPSIYEGFGMVAAEAMTVGVPVIVPAQSGVAEIVGEFDAGLVMASSSVEALDRAFAELEENPDRRRQLGAAGIRAANSLLTFEAFAERTGAVYRELMPD